MLCAACMGVGGLSVSRPSLMNTIRCSVTWHSEQTNVCRSTPRTVAVSSGTTFVRINSAPQAVQRITRTGTHTHRAPTRWWEYRTLAILWCGNPLRCGLRLLRVCRGGDLWARKDPPSSPRNQPRPPLPDLQEFKLDDPAHCSGRSCDDARSLYIRRCPTKLGIRP
jgi:hypothetical protein